MAELHFHIPANMLDTLDLEAMALGKTRSELVRKIVGKAKLDNMEAMHRMQVTVKIDDIQHRKIQWLAAKLKVSMSEVMRILIEEELRS